MDIKERFINTLSFKKVDRVPNMEIGLWPQTMLRWKNEGLPKGILNKEKINLIYHGNKYLDIDEGVETLDIETRLPYPWFKEKILEESKGYLLFIDNFGRIRKTLKKSYYMGTSMSMDEYIDFPVKDRETFLKYKKYFMGNIVKRYPKNYKQIKSNYKNIKKPLMLLNFDEPFGYYSMLRRWMGTERLSYMFYDDPKLIFDACKFLTEYIINLLTLAVEGIKFDLYVFHEDLAYKNGPLISPAMFKKFFLNGYKRVVSFLKSHGVGLVLVDTDGNFEDLINLFLDAGIDGFLPMEVAANMDPVRIRKKYGKSFCMIGGVDKRELSKDKKHIKSEIEKLSPIIKESGYIPCVDHTIPPDISLENFRYYISLKRNILNQS